jgi:hypothetical protein
VVSAFCVLIEHCRRISRNTFFDECSPLTCVFANKYPCLVIHVVASFSRFGLDGHATAVHNTVMRDRSRKPTDVNVLGKSIVDQATGAVPKILPPVKDPAAVELGRRGGLKGGKARAAKMTKKERAASARKAAKARWTKQPPSP